MSVWKDNKQEPKNGSKIEMVFDPKTIEVDVWKNGSLVLGFDEWDHVKKWRYLDENYLERMGLLEVGNVDIYEYALMLWFCGEKADYEAEIKKAVKRYKNTRDAIPTLAIVPEEVECPGNVETEDGDLITVVHRENVQDNHLEIGHKVGKFERETNDIWE